MALDALAMETPALDQPVLDYVIALEQPSQADAVLALTDRAFGPGRFVKTAERLRENSTPLADLSYVALDGARVIASVRLWPVFVQAADETRAPIAFLGPIVVDEACRGHRIGSRLTEAAVTAAFAKGLRAVLLVGSRAFFEPLGFARAEGLIMPGPVDPNRLLIRYATDGDALSGQVVRVL
ncbi:MAG TPA: N-acetyltransferase [Asticcacaulis sp.]